ncbi:MAG: hypothetical protein ABEI52_02380 [Halobacteriaceae archaeon]
MSPEVHLFQHVALLVMLFWWTKGWLLEKPETQQRWRFIVAALAGAIGWIIVAYTATGSVAASSGVTILYQSMAIAYFSAFMAFLSVIAIPLGLLMWVEEETEKASEDIPEWAESDLGD